MALPSVLETTFGTSDEDTTFYGLHHTESGSTGTAQPSSPVNHPRAGLAMAQRVICIPTQVKPLCFRAQQDSTQPNLNHQDVAKRILTAFHQTNLHYCCLDCLHHLLMQNRLEGLSIYYQRLSAGAGIQEISVFRISSSLRNPAFLIILQLHPCKQGDRCCSDHQQ